MPAPTEMAANAVARRRQERRDVAALAPAHAADPLRVHPALLDQVLDAREHVPGVADAEVADVELAELLAVAGAAAVVDLQDERAARGPDVRRVVRASSMQRRPVDARRPAVDDAEQRRTSSPGRSRPA